MYKKLSLANQNILNRIIFIRLPRVIVCGYTDMFPKIVVADTERKGREKCFEKLTGKLTESLTMQEKLVKENAQLEGGKYVHLLYNINFKQIHINQTDYILYDGYIYV